jgi:hypothetical protein
MKGPMERAIIQVPARVNVSSAEARRWFLELEAHPERYQFDTHAGFAFSEGSFGETGAHFETWEQFGILTLNLHFELTETADTHFRFRLIRPPLPIWCAFVIEEIAEDTTALRLEVGGTTRIGDWVLQLPIVRDVIQQQIRREVEHIKASMEMLHNRADSGPVLTRH